MHQESYLKYINGLYKSVLSNIKSLPYRSSNNQIYLKNQIYKNNRFSYLDDLDTELWLNVNGWEMVDSSTTNKYGVSYLTYSTDLIPSGTHNCLAVTCFSYRDKEYWSNLVRINLYE